MSSWNPIMGHITWPLKRHTSTLMLHFSWIIISIHRRKDANLPQATLSIFAVSTLSSLNTCHCCHIPSFLNTCKKRNYKEVLKQHFNFTKPFLSSSLFTLWWVLNFYCFAHSSLRFSFSRVTSNGFHPFPFGFFPTPTMKNSFTDGICGFFSGY